MARPDLKYLIFILMMALAAACERAPQEVIYEVVYVTATPGPSPTITLTPTPSSTPTPSPTPTPTAPPAEIFADLRGPRLQPPAPAGGAPCGFVDILDFPLDPPDAAQAGGGGDFGVFRSRYDKYHAGEDWGGVSGRSNFGTPVHSVGHGIVTYAQPLGWGVDQGVVIVRHTFPDGSSLLSFYGHLDPPSVVLRPGACVARGDIVGEIGRPRGWPHLHFEMRTHLPDAPGPGYWPVDPTRGGWVSPSQTIWANRMAGSPGVLWAQVMTSRQSYGLGEIAEGTFLAQDGDHLISIDLANGRTRWEQVLEEGQEIDRALLDLSDERVYTVDQLGLLQALEISQSDGIIRLDKGWEIDLEVVGRPGLLPLPGGGVIVTMPRTWTAVSEVGDLLWQEQAPGVLVDWIQAGERLILAVRGERTGIWIADQTGLSTWTLEVVGRLARINEEVFLYDGAGVYRLTAGSEDLELHYALPSAYPRLGDMVVSSESELIIVHADRQDRKVIALSQDGEIRWERSVAGLPGGDFQLIVSSGRAYLAVWNTTSRENQLQVYAISENGESLQLVFSGGTRTPFSAGAWLEILGNDWMLIRIGGGGLALLDPQQALIDLSLNE